MIPARLLQKLAGDPRIPRSSRDSFLRTLKLDEVWRSERHQVSSVADRKVEPLAPSAEVIVCDCAGSEVLPGVVIDPANTMDATVLRAFDFTRKLVSFYEQCLARNSIDGSGKALLSSVHYSRIYSNAYWSSDLMQMVYGDGDGFILLDFTLSPEFIAHEVAHGLTHFTSDLDYTEEAGALNESISDVLGTVFVQWLYGHDVRAAHWQIGPDLIGPTAKQLGWLCVRDLANPSATHSMTQQPVDFDSYIPGGDPHDNSGIPNRAFYLAASEIGGFSWEIIGRIWYAATLDRKCHPKLTFSEFARITIEHAVSMFPLNPSVAIAVFRAWNTVRVRI
jgi:Zn-dependent metalloprotease